MNDTWTYDGTKWTQVMTSNAPPPRSAASLAKLGNKLVLFAGLDMNVTELQDTWTFDGTNWTQVNASNSPPPVVSGTIAFVP
jgi:hypothetical protein